MSSHEEQCRETANVTGCVEELHSRSPGPCLERSWCHNGTMKRMNLRDVPDEVYTALAEAAEENRQSLSAFVVDRLTEVARATRLDDYVASYRPPQGSGITVDDATAAVREVREAS